MCGALAISPPSASKIAQEKSSRSLMLTECAVARSRTPICSATDMNRLLKISSITGSTAVPRPACAGPRRDARRAAGRPARSAPPASPARTTVVAKSSTISAGPADPLRRGAGPGAWPAAHLVQAPPDVHQDGCSGTAAASCRAAVAGCPGRPPGRGPPATGAASGADAAVSSTDTASTMIVLSRMRKEKCCRYAASKSPIMLGSGPERDRQRGVGALVLQVGPAHDRGRPPGSTPSPHELGPRARRAGRRGHRSSSGSRPADSGASTAVSRIAVTSARPIPTRTAPRPAGG